MSADDEATDASPRRPPERVYARLAAVGTTAQAAIPGLYAWAITVMPAAWTRGAPLAAKVAAVVGLLALLTAPIVEGAGGTVAPSTATPTEPSPPVRSRGRAWSGPTWARAWSVWGFVLASALVWALVPTALSSARFDGLRGALGIVGWALFAFASAGPALRPRTEEGVTVVRSASLKPRSSLPRGDGTYITAGAVIALGLQAVGWEVVSPERAVLVRLVTVVCGIAVLGAATTLALSRHAPRPRPSTRARLRRGLPWLVVVLALGAGALVVGSR